MYSRVGVSTQKNVQPTRIVGPRRVTFEWAKGLTVGVNPLDVGEYGGIVDVENLALNRMDIERTQAFSVYVDSSVTGTPLAIANVTSTTGSTSLYLVTTEKFYELVSGAWTLVGNYTGDLDERVSWVYTYDSTLKDVFVFSSSKDYVKYYNGTTYGNLSGLTNTKASCCAMFKSRLVLGGTEESGTASPFRIRWSRAGDITDWSSRGSGFIDLIDTPGGIVKFGYFMDRLFVFKDDSIWELVYVGGSKIFVPALIIEGTGIIAPDSLVSWESNGMLFLGNDDVYVFDGRTIVSIGNEFVRDLLYGSASVLNASYQGRSVGVYVEQERKYKLAIPTTNSYPDTLLVFDFASKTWWKEKPSIPVYCFGVAYRDTDITWNDLTGTWAEQSWIWIDRSISIGSQRTLVGSTSKVYEIDFTKLTSSDSVLETGDYMFSEGTRWVQLAVELYGSGTATLYYSKDEGNSWTSLGSKTGGSATYDLKIWNFNVTANKMRFRLVLGSGCNRLRKVFAYVMLRSVL